MDEKGRWAWVCYHDLIPASETEVEGKRLFGTVEESAQRHYQPLLEIVQAIEQETGEAGLFSTSWRRWVKSRNFAEVGFPEDVEHVLIVLIEKRDGESFEIDLHFGFLFLWWEKWD